MKSVLIVGLGRFGRHLAKKMQELGNTVMVVDIDEAIIEMNAPHFKNALQADLTHSSVVERMDVSQFDICFVTIGDNFQSSLVVTSLLKRHGAKYVVSKAKRDIQEEILRQIGADEIVYPEREIAEKLAVRFNAKNIFDYIPLTSEYSIYEIPIMPEWAGQTLVEANVRRKHKISIIAIKSKGGKMMVTPPPDYTFERDDRIVVIGGSTDVFRLTAKIK